MILLLLFAPRLRAQQTDNAQSGAAPQASQDNGEPQAEPSEGDQGHTGTRIFGVLPNYTTVEGAKQITPISAGQKFKMAAQNSFDPYVFPFIGVVAGIGAGQGESSYGRRYAMALADNSFGNFMTTAILPTALHQDPRYFQLGQGTMWHRVGYALSRSAVTRGKTGKQFNMSEIGGNLIAASLSNLYYPEEDRSASQTVTRWGSQVMWDSLANVLKEFWPDIRQRFHKKQA